MPTFKRLALLCGLAVLAACALAPETQTADAPRRVLVTKGAVVIAGPPGFCVDTSASRNGASTALVILGNCAAVERNATRPQPDVPGVLTAAVMEGPGALPPAPVMDAWVQSNAGRATLSATGRAEDFQLIETRIRNDVLYVHARDLNETELAGRQSDYWRAFLSVGTRMITVSLRDLGDGSVPPGREFSTLDAFATRILAENRAF